MNATEPTLYDLLRLVVAASDPSAPKCYYMGQRAYEFFCGIRRQRRSRARRARYNRGKLGVRPRKRSGR